MSERRAWTREDDIVACALYAVTDYSKIHKGNPQIIRAAEKLGCSPSSLAMRMAIYAALDPVGRAKGHKGFDSASKQAKEVFAEFQGDWEAVKRRAEEIVGPLEYQP